MSGEHKDVKLNKLINPTCVTKTETNQGILYLVCEAGNDTIRIYSSSWDLQRSIGSLGLGDGQLNTPWYVHVLPMSSILVADCCNHRISEYTINVQFILIFYQQDRIFTQISYHLPHLWVLLVSGFKTFNLKCFQIFKS